jgi:hypothetical protein
MLSGTAAAKSRRLQRFSNHAKWVDAGGRSTILCAISDITIVAIRYPPICQSVLGKDASQQVSSGRMISGKSRA